MTLFGGDATTQMFLRAERRDRFVMSEIDADQMLHVLVAVLAGAHETERSAMSTVERRTVELGGEQDVVGFEVGTHERRRLTVSRRRDEKGRQGTVGDASDDLAKSNAAPAQPAAGPRGHAMEVAALLDAVELGKMVGSKNTQ